MLRRLQRRWSEAPGGRRETALALVLALQAMAAVFFVGDVLADITFDGADLHLVLEAAVALALVLGVLFGALEMRRTLEEAERSRTALSAARGAMTDLIEARFAAWRLTPAETEVAFLALKGFDVAAIAGLRGAAAGTVRAQLARVYAKSGVASRAELLSLFMDDLIAGPVAGEPSGADAARLPAA
ncbi:helix-turn-helix transcriptional regulator [Paralimibaculum aggregatum]|uniref:Helix-turn-helix transcriptional regulator n=1 Tax=Paralimibaculum aggregatum TaxID=3036245 RepID=A0ABQ6LMV4_9RHOB|nr:helix-turn-helix transcriptional regulator [Limibaculum sp. NKW23]GMG84527.1 helix-turn-helix transcriptional regulator [Limibaculum sp. NKW23]